MGNDAPFFCWDACVLIEFFCSPVSVSPERDKRLSGIDAILEKVESGEARIIAPVVWRVELLDHFLTPDKKHILNDFLRKSEDFLSVSIDTRIAEKAHDIRNRFQQLRNEDAAIGKISGMDCLYPATAIVYKAVEFHTFDERLLKLNGDPSLEELVIKSPIEYINPQGRLF